MPHNISIQRILATVNALSTLHHFCINEYLHLRSSTIPEALAADHNNIITSTDGYIQIELDDDNQDFVTPTDLMYSCHHFVEAPNQFFQAYHTNYLEDAWPGTVLHDFIVAGHWEQP